jgi:hypothetical protein
LIAARHDTQRRIRNPAGLSHAGFCRQSLLRFDKRIPQTVVSLIPAKNASLYAVASASLKFPAATPVPRETVRLSPASVPTTDAEDCSGALIPRCEQSDVLFFSSVRSSGASSGACRVSIKAAIVFLPMLLVSRPQHENSFTFVAPFGRHHG